MFHLSMRKHEMPRPGRQKSVLSGLPKTLSEQLFLGASKMKIAADQTLFMAGDAGEGCYHIISGLLKVTMLSTSGAERILAILGPGSIVGELAMLDGLPRSASVVAVRDSELQFVSKAKFEDCTRKHPEVYKHLVALLASRLRETDEVIAAESFLPLKGRVAMTLLELADHFGDDVGAGRIVIRHKFGQGELAAMAGIARENVNRILADWKRKKLVSRLSGYYCLESKSKLESEVNL
jgi:CRP/FNR family cyclic AMP-dependent transcriptional regulator